MDREISFRINSDSLPGKSFCWQELVGVQIWDTGIIALLQVDRLNLETSKIFETK